VGAIGSKGCAVSRLRDPRGRERTRPESRHDVRMSLTPLPTVTWRICPFDGLTLRELQNIFMARQLVFSLEQNCAYLDADGHDEKRVAHRGVVCRSTPCPWLMPDYSARHQVRRAVHRASDHDIGRARHRPRRELVRRSPCT